jgi:hypothetical protein
MYYVAREDEKALIFLQLLSNIFSLLLGGEEKNEHTSVIF